MRIVRIVLTKLFTTAVVAAVVAVVAITSVVPRLVGGASLAVLSGSMRPTIPTGSLVLVKPVDPAQIEPNDIITWQVRPGVASYVTHRVVRTEVIDGDVWFITKGDANAVEDQEPVPMGAVRGRVLFHVPYLGAVTSRLGTQGALGLVAAAGGVYLLTGVVRSLFRSKAPAPAHALGSSGHSREVAVPESAPLDATSVAAGGRV